MIKAITDKEFGDIVEEMSSELVYAWNNCDEVCPHSAGSKLGKVWAVANIIASESPACLGEVGVEITPAYELGFMHAAFDRVINPFAVPKGKDCGDFSSEEWNVMYLNFVAFAQGNAWYRYATAVRFAQKYSNYYY